MKKLQLKKWKCRENDIEAVHNNKGYAYQRKLDALEEVRKGYYPIKRAIDLVLS
ncbi:sugar transferase, partial [Staphylococcus aureus]